MKKYCYIEIQNNKIVTKGETNTVNEIKFPSHQIEVTEDIYNAIDYMPCGFDADENGQIIAIHEVPYIPYTIDKSTILTTETAIITVPADTVAIIDGQEYPPATEQNTTIEYSNENVGIHEIKLILYGYRDTIVSVEVV